MNEEIIRKQQQAMTQEGLDALISSSPENLAYTVGFVVPSQLLMRWRHAMCVVTGSGHTTMLTIDMEETTVKAHVSVDNLCVYREFTDDPIVELGHALSAQGLASATIGIEMEYLSARDFETLCQTVPHANFVPADGIFRRLRQVKTAGEVNLLRTLSRITDDAIDGTLRAAKLGITELELAGQLTSRVFSGGAEDFKLMIIASGERSQFPNVGPSEKKLVAGDLIRMEIFGVRNGYHAGVCRTAVMGKPTAEQTQIWRNLIECKHLVMQLIKPGANAKQIYTRFLQKFAELGLEPISFVGHGIGVNLHEEPYLGRYGDTNLEAGMVLAIEPLVYIPGRMGLQNKDMLLVTDDGCDLLSDVTPTEQLMEIG